MLQNSDLLKHCKILVGESEFSDHGYYVSVEAHMFALDYVTSGYVGADIEMS